MSSQLSFFEGQEAPFAPATGEIPAPARRAAGLFGVEQPSFRAVMPDRYLKGLDAAPRAVAPFQPALVIYGTGSDVACDDMQWGMANGIEIAPTVMRRGLWPGRPLSRNERRCVVVAASFSLVPDDESRTVLSIVTPDGDDPFYLAGLCGVTALGPAFRLIERPARGSFKRAGRTMPMLIEEDDVWDWLNTGSWSLRPDFGFAHPGHVISLAPRPQAM